MRLLPSWPLEALTLAIGLGIGAYVDHAIMQSRIDKLTVAHAEELRVREVQRSKDEVAAREKERLSAVRVGQIEQDKTNEIARIRVSYSADIARLQNRADRKPATAGGVPAPVPACAGSTGAELSRPDAVFLSGIAARADELRAGLSACYQAYDTVGE